VINMWLLTESPFRSSIAATLLADGMDALG